MKYITIIFFIAITTCSCFFRSSNKIPADTLKIYDLNIFNLPLLSTGTPLPNEDFFLKAALKDSLVESLYIFHIRHKKPMVIFHYYSKDSISGYYSDPFSFAGCRYIDSFLVQKNKIYYSKECSGYKSNAIFEKAADTLKVTKYFYEGSGDSKDLARRDNWQGGTSEVRNFYLIQKQAAMEYHRNIPDGVYFSSDFWSFGSNQNPNSFFWHIIYISYILRY